MHDWRVRLILGAVVALFIGAYVWGVVSDDEEPTQADERSSAESVCRTFLERQVEPLDVEHRAPGTAAIRDDGTRFRIQDRAAIGGDLVSYECRVDHLPDGDWKLVNLSLR